MKHLLTACFAMLVAAAFGICQAQEPAPDQSPEQGAPAPRAERPRGEGFQHGAKGDHARPDGRFQKGDQDRRGDFQRDKGQRPEGGPKMDGQRGPRPEGCPMMDGQRGPRPEGCPMMDGQRGPRPEGCPMMDGQRGPRPEGCPMMDGPCGPGPEGCPMMGPFQGKRHSGPRGPFPCPKLPFVNEDGNIVVAEAIEFMNQVDADGDGTITKEELKASFEKMMTPPPAPEEASPADEPAPEEAPAPADEPAPAESPAE